MTATSKTGCERTERVAEYALRALPASERAAFEAHVERVSRVPPGARGASADRRRVRRLADRHPAPAGAAVGTARGAHRRRLRSANLRWQPERGWRDEPEWKEVAPGISCKLLATDAAKERVSMLVRLAPGVAYPPHSHAGVEELHLLDGELWIDDRKLYPGDYNRAEPGTTDSRVWSETGCTCVLVTSFGDILR